MSIIAKDGLLAYNRREVAEMTGLDYSLVTNWATGRPITIAPSVPSPRSGELTYYSMADLFDFFFAKKLVQLGIPPRAVQSCLKATPQVVIAAGTVAANEQPGVVFLYDKEPGTITMIYVRRAQADDPVVFSEHVRRENFRAYVDIGAVFDENHIAIGKRLYPTEHFPTTGSALAAAITKAQNEGRAMRDKTEPSSEFDTYRLGLMGQMSIALNDATRKKLMNIIEEKLVDRLPKDRRDGMVYFVGVATSEPECIFVPTGAAPPDGIQEQIQCFVLPWKSILDFVDERVEGIAKGLVESAKPEPIKRT
jgi:hypothetical protein